MIYIDESYCAESFNDLYSNIVIPVYPQKTRSFRKYYDFEAKVKSVSYNIEQPYPANNVINFYNNSMIKSKFKPYTNDLYPNTWIVFQDISTENESYIRQFSKIWVNKNYKIKSLLILRYKSFEKNRWGNNLLITFQMMPAMNEKAIHDLLDKLKEGGKFQEFMTLLNKYSTPNGDVDFIKAIKENPENMYLVEYYNLVKKIIPKKK